MEDRPSLLRDEKVTTRSSIRNIATDSHASLVTDGVRAALQSVPQHIVHQVTSIHIRHVSTYVIILSVLQQVSGIITFYNKSQVLLLYTSNRYP
jgi:hypothetical protein